MRLAQASYQQFPTPGVGPYFSKGGIPSCFDTFSISFSRSLFCWSIFVFESIIIEEIFITYFWLFRIFSFFFKFLLSFPIFFFFITLRSSLFLVYFVFECIIKQKNLYHLFLIFQDFQFLVYHFKIFAFSCLFRFWMHH